MRALLIGLLATFLGISAAHAEDPEWLPGDGERTEETRSGPSFGGMDYLFPLRLHLVRGGFIEGTMGGMDEVEGEFLLLRPGDAFRIDVRLIDSVTPLGRIPVGREGIKAPPPMLVERHSEFRWRPTWRSGAGLALSFLLPGAGQWIQESHQELGFIFLGGAAFFVATGLLALYAPSQYGPVQRRILSGIMFGMAGTVSITAGAHAWTTGRRRVEVEVAGARVRSSDGRQRRRR
jgi:hypothetical protein